MLLPHPFRYTPIQPRPLRLSCQLVLPKAQMPTAAAREPPSSAARPREPANIWVAFGSHPYVSPLLPHLLPRWDSPLRLWSGCLSPDATLQNLLLKAATAHVPAPYAAGVSPPHPRRQRQFFPLRPTPPLHLPCGAPPPGLPPQPLLPAAAARASLQPVVPDTSPAPTAARGAQPGRLPASARGRASPDGAGGGGRYL